jgi:hypothetical protein
MREGLPTSLEFHPITIVSTFMSPDDPSFVTEEACIGSSGLLPLQLRRTYFAADEVRLLNH